ncbi:MAG: hypothetical protein K9L98_03380 [Candidatus Pacebacteria bacterium]|nr:hypothetical protein [Candidatus Paceibacterota bacterium]MCF7863020.1 hypothetical protein [Candidatus Paceibacterota bacterium]
MEKPQFEAKFKKTKKTLESSEAKIIEFLKDKTINEKDRIRLTRVLQLVERYQPTRSTKELKLDKWLKYLETIYRSLPNIKKDQKEIENISANSYLLAEKTIASLRELRHIDLNLEKENEFSEDEILNQKRSSEVKEEEILDTSLTLEYEKKNWGVERVCLDGIQNHLPSDSKGEHVWVMCLINGKWVSLLEATQNKNKIEAVRFADDGVGFDVKNLSLLYSTKAEEKDSRGQFGEGMKMMAAAALREGLKPEMESQDWKATPISKEVKLYDTRNEKNQTIQQLSFKVDYLEGKPMIGSRTTFYKPTKAFVDELMQIENKILALHDNYRPLFVGSVGEIVDSESGNLFVKGIYVNSQNTLLSYNFEDVETNRDRNSIVSNGWERRIQKIIEEIPNKRLAKTIIQKSILNTRAIESSFYDLNPKHPSIWTEGFYEAFGKDAVLDTGFRIPDTFKNNNINKIKVPYGISNLLLKAGIKTDREATPDFWEEIIPTSLTLEYGKDIWGEERILLDAVQNHLPNDSGGSSIGLRFKTKDGGWHSFQDLLDIKNEDIEAIKIYDNGRGYDSRLLGFFYSTKGEQESTGKFGEGLKMLCVASIRKGIDITLRSQNWSAKPRTLRQDIDGKQIDQLVFDVTHTAKKQGMDDDNGVYQKSSTTFSNLTPELLEEFRQINKKVLAIEEKKPVESTINGDILSLDGGMVYVRELLIPGDHDLLFTYHLPKLEIKNRDRSFIDQQELVPQIAKVWSQVESPEVIRSFLFKANLEAQKVEGNDKLEFAMDFTPKDTEGWKKIFEEVFGKNTAIRDMRSEDYDAMQQNMHVGLELVSFPSAVYRVLQRIGLPTYESRIREMSDVEDVPNEELTVEEKKMIEILTAIDEYLPNNKPSQIKIYEPKYNDQKVAEGFSNGTDIYLRRGVLSNFLHAADVYVHEKTHHNTNGAQDASSGFRNYLTLALANMALDQLKKVRPDLIN